MFGNSRPQNDVYSAGFSSWSSQTPHTNGCGSATVNYTLGKMSIAPILEWARQASTPPSSELQLGPYCLSYSFPGLTTPRSMHKEWNGCRLKFVQQAITGKWWFISSCSQSVHWIVDTQKLRRQKSFRWSDDSSAQTLFHYWTMLACYHIDSKWSSYMNMMKSMISMWILIPLLAVFKKATDFFKTSIEDVLRWEMIHDNL
jgi:hypothetical protein